MSIRLDGGSFPTAILVNQNLYSKRIYKYKPIASFPLVSLFIYRQPNEYRTEGSVSKCSCTETDDLIKLIIFANFIYEVKSWKLGKSSCILDVRRK